MAVFCQIAVIWVVAQAIEKKLGYKLNVISGGGTSTLPEEINQLRIGEGILLETDTTNSRKISWIPEFKDDGIRKRAILALGKQDGMWKGSCL